MPLDNEVLDVGVFSLSLMGTNYAEFLKEANRVLKPGAILFVAEVTSRFSEPQDFIKLMKEDMGFHIMKMNKLKDFFYLMVFKRVNYAKPK